MPLSKYYLPDIHDFEHVAKARWPAPMPQIDWVDSVTVMELWLEQYVGPHYTRWAWATSQDHEPWQACVAFKWAKHKTLFLLTWA